MANIKFIRMYDFYNTAYCDIAYARNDGCISRVRTIPAEEMPKTAYKWLKDKHGTRQYNKVFERDEIIYKAETKYKVEFDFRFNGEDVHAYLDNNGKGFDKENAVRVGKELVAQGNQHVMLVAI